MPLINLSRVINNVIVLVIMGWFAFMLWSKINKEKVKGLIDGITNLFGGKEK